VEFINAPPKQIRTTLSLKATFCERGIYTWGFQILCQAIQSQSPRVNLWGESFDGIEPNREVPILASCFVSEVSKIGGCRVANGRNHPEIGVSPTLRGYRL